MSVQDLGASSVFRRPFQSEMPAISLDMGMTGTGGLNWLNRVTRGRLTSLCAFLIFTSFASNIKSAVCPYWIKAGPMNLAELVFNHNGIAVFSLLVVVLFRQWLGRYLWRHPFRKASLFLI